MMRLIRGGRAIKVCTKPCRLQGLVLIARPRLQQVYKKPTLRPQGALQHTGSHRAMRTLGQGGERLLPLIESLEGFRTHCMGQTKSSTLPLYRCCPKTRRLLDSTSRSRKQVTENNPISTQGKQRQRQSPNFFFWNITTSKFQRAKPFSVLMAFAAHPPKLNAGTAFCREQCDTHFTNYPSTKYDHHKANIENKWHFSPASVKRVHILMFLALFFVLA